MSIFVRYAILLPFYLCAKALPRNPKILSCGNGEKKCFDKVEQVISDEK